ncbi:MAG: TRAP transporter substrate-binding protein [Lautropia sp.]
MNRTVRSLLGLSLASALLATGPAFAQADPKAGKKVVANIASVYPPDSPMDLALNRIRDTLATQTGGRIDVRVHRGGAMGDEKQTFETLSQGSVEFGALGVGDIAAFFPRYFVSEVPYLFSSQQDFWKFWNGPGKELSALIEKQRGVRQHGIVYRGARYLTSNTPVNAVADVKGLKMRLPPIKAWFKVWEGLGAIPQSIAFSEVYMALKTGVVAAQENPPETILAYKMFEAQKYLVATEHVYGAARLVSSVSWWSTLSKDDQALFTKVIDDAMAFGNGMTKDGDAEMVKKLEAAGMTLIKVDKAAFKAAVQPAVDAMAKTDWDPAFYQKVLATLK